MNIVITKFEKQRKNCTTCDESLKLLLGMFQGSLNLHQITLLQESLCRAKTMNICCLVVQVAILETLKKKHIIRMFICVENVEECFIPLFTTG